MKIKEFVEKCLAVVASSREEVVPQKIAVVLKEALQDAGFRAEVTAALGAGDRIDLFVGHRPDLCVTAHHRTGARDGNPHDHGATWAAHGQISGQSYMIDWVASGADERVTPTRSIVLEEGEVELCQQGAIHSTARRDDVRLLTVTKLDLNKTPWRNYEPVDGLVLSQTYPQHWSLSG